MMRKNEHNRRKLNNKGLSLVEVLVAMLVLSVASIALLRSFSYAVQLNTKSKENQQALVLAQSLMESLKAYDVDGLDVQFDPTETSFDLYPLSGGEVRSKAGVDLEARTYRLDNVEQSGNAYDVLINMTPRVTQNLATYTSPNRHMDAFFQQEYEEKQELFDGILQRLQTVWGADPANTMVVNPNQIKIHSRQMNLVITDNQVNYYVTYKYSLIDYEIVKTDATIEQISESNITYTIDYATDFSNVQKYENTAEMQSNGVMLKNIYLYYYPNYKTLSYDPTLPYVVPCDSDELLIENNSLSIKNVYVIRQKDVNLTDASLAIGESDYRLKVDNSTTQFVNLYHNVQNSLTGSGSPDFSGTPTNVNDMGSPWQASVEATNLLYDVSINVYKHGTSDVVCSLVGTTNAQ